jgi:protoheme IX farnesyltransferase
MRRSPPNGSKKTPKSPLGKINKKTPKKAKKLVTISPSRSLTTTPVIINQKQSSQQLNTNSDQNIAVNKQTRNFVTKLTPQQVQFITFFAPNPSAYVFKSSPSTPINTTTSQQQQQQQQQIIPSTIPKRQFSTSSSVHTLPNTPSLSLSTFTNSGLLSTSNLLQNNKNPKNPKNSKNSKKINDKKKLTLFTERLFSTVVQLPHNANDLSFSWSQEEQLESRSALDQVRDIPSAVTSLGELFSGTLSEEDFVQKWAPYIIPAHGFEPDLNSPFSPLIQRSVLFRSFPKSLRNSPRITVLPADFDRSTFVSRNIDRFHTDTFPTDTDILNLLNHDALDAEFGQFLNDLSVEGFAHGHGLGYIGVEPELQLAIRNRIQRDSRGFNPIQDPIEVLDLLPPQMDAIDGLLAFALPKVTPQQNNQMMIAHLKRKAELLTAEYNDDPFYISAIRRRQGLALAEQQLAIERTNLESELNAVADAAVASIVDGKQDDENTQREALLLQRKVVIDDLGKQLKDEKNSAQLSTITTETLGTLRKLPNHGSITPDNIDKASAVLKDKKVFLAPGEVESQVRADLQKKREKQSTKPSWMKSLSNYYQLTKPRISQMVAATALWGYWSAGNGTNWTDLALLTTGTVALSSSASIINQMRETDVDAKMTRTMARPLVTKSISLESAKKQAIAYSIIGTSLLTPLTTIVPVLGLSNVALYGGLYTSLKRTTPLNTEIGALVGAIPPLMGYFAALTPDQSWDHNLTALCFPAAMMIAWQIQHVMLICVRRGDEYNRSGLVMQCKDDPGFKKTINKGIAWSVISTIISSIPFFTGNGDLTQLFTTYMWAIYTVPYAIAMKNRDHKRLGHVLLAGYAVLGFTILLSLNAQVPEDAFGYLFTQGPSAPTPLPETPPTLIQTLFQGAGKVGTDPVLPAGVTDAVVVDGNATPSNVPLAAGQQKLASITEQILNSEHVQSTHDDV